jgi:hypothetical protein
VASPDLPGWYPLGGSGRIGDNVIFSISRTYLCPQVRRRHDLSSLRGG